MTRNVTLKLDSTLLKQCRQMATRAEKSLSQWVAGLMRQAVSEQAGYGRAKERALKRLESGFSLGGQPLTRNESHER